MNFKNMRNFFLNVKEIFLEEIELLGIKFAPINVSLEKHLQTFATAAWFLTLVFGGIGGFFLCIFLVLDTTLRWVVVPYLFWIYFIDRHTPERGGRISPWFRKLKWWKYVRDYFPLKLVKQKKVSLDPKKNYLFGCFPHGMVPTGPYNAFCSHYGGFKELFPNHESYIVTLPQQFVLPIGREMIMGLGGVPCTPKAMEYILSTPGGGNVLAVVVGGAPEAYYCKPGTYRVILKRRKGFIRLALRNGTPLVPVFSFGETDLYDQFSRPWLRKIQEDIRKWIGVAPIIPIGRGFFQYSFGLIPQRRPVTTVVGRPIEVPRIEVPTNDQVNTFHAIFTKRLIQLFEENKYKYLDDPRKKKLIIE